MSHFTEHSWTNESLGPVLNGDETRERRQWVRFVFPDLVTRLSWFDGTETVTHLVNLVNVSASGVAVSLDVRPPTDRPVMILFSHGGVTTGPIPADLVAIEYVDGERYLVKYAFHSLQTTGSLLHHQRDAPRLAARGPS